MIHQCPACKSDHVKKLSLVYEEGKFASIGINSSSSVGIGVGASGLGFGVAKTEGATSGISQSLLSEKHAPPLKGPEPKMKQKWKRVYEGDGEPTDWPGWFMNFGLVALFLSPIMWLIGLIGIGPGFLWLFGTAIFFFLLAAILPAPPKPTEEQLKQRKERKKQLKEKEEQLNKSYRIAEMEHIKAMEYYYKNDPYYKWERSFLCLVCGHKFESK